MNEGLEKKAYPGCRVLVAKDGLVIYDKAFGFYNYGSREKVTRESVYDLASVSKATGTLLAVMKAYDEKKFKLNDKISSFLPELKESNKRNVTIKSMLLSSISRVVSVSAHKIVAFSS